VRGHKGGISVSSEPGKGTTFQVFFPVEAGRRVLHAKI
jgi:signal transduction histidine kinase